MSAEQVSVQSRRWRPRLAWLWILVAGIAAYLLELWVLLSTQGLHAAWDGRNSLFVHVFVGLVSFGSLLFTIFWTDRRGAAQASAAAVAGA